MNPNLADLEPPTHPSRLLEAVSGFWGVVIGLGVVVALFVGFLPADAEDPNSLRPGHGPTPEASHRNVEPGLVVVQYP